MFQSAPAIAGGRILGMPYCAWCSALFQSAPAIAGGRIPSSSGERSEFRRVSIRARHCWRANPSSTSVPLRRLMFQSAPAIAGGRIHNGHSVCVAVEMVSIRARHCWRANRGLRTAGVPVQRVSIRARHCWRANLRLGLRSLALCLFQSAPAIAGGRIPRATLSSAPFLSMFQSAPAIAGGRILQALPPHLLAVRVSIRARHCWRANHLATPASLISPIVSIRARHCWRANPACEVASTVVHKPFQSAPAIAGGRIRGIFCVLP